MDESGKSFQVVLTGAFSTGTPLRVPLSEYADLQAELGKKLDEKQEDEGEQGDEGEQEEKEWNPEGVPWLAQPSYDEGGGGYSNLVPLVLIQREGEKLGNGIPAGRSLDPRWTWELEEVRIQLFDLGVGVVVGVYKVEPPGELAAKDAAEQIRAWSNITRDAGGAIELPVGAAYEQLAKETVETFRAALEKCVDPLPEPWLPPTLTMASEGRRRADGSDAGGERPAGDEPPPMTREQAEEKERGRLKWLHPVFVLPLPVEDGDRARRASAEDFQAVHSKAADFDDGLFVPGVKRSVVVHDGGDEDPLGPSTPIGLITLNWAYYALFMDIDRGLLVALDECHRDDEAASFQRLEDDAKEAYGKYVQVAEAKARLDSALNGLGPGQVKLWEAIVEVTRFGQLVKSVESKLEMLQTIAESRVQEAAAKSARRGRRILTALTAATVITLGTALVGYFAGSQTDRAGHEDTRLIVVAIAVVVAFAIFLLAELDFRWGRLVRSGSAKKSRD